MRAGAPDVSVILPTRERASTLRHALHSVTREKEVNIEIIVCDNASRDTTEAVVRENADPRIRYVRSGRRLGMSSNWELALSHARGEWIAVLGDDDALIPGGLAHALTLAEAFRVPLVRCRPCEYLWPQRARTPDGRLAIPLQRKAEVRATRQWLERVLAGKDPYTELPTIYTGGLVRRDMVDRGRGPDGRFFRSQIPDVYSAVRLSALGGHYIFADRPFAVNGASSMSTGISIMHPSRKVSERAPHQMFSAEDNIPLHARVPQAAAGGPPPSVHALVYESYLQVLAIEPSLPPLEAGQQLAIVVAEAPAQWRDLGQWVEKFAAANGIPPISTHRRGWRQTLGKWRRRLRADRMIITNNAMPVVPDVSAAAVVASRHIAMPSPGTGAVIANLAAFALQSAGVRRSLGQG